MDIGLVKCENQIEILKCVVEILEILEFYEYR